MQHANYKPERLWTAAYLHGRCLSLLPILACPHPVRPALALGQQVEEHAHELQAVPGDGGGQEHGREGVRMDVARTGVHVLQRAHLTQPNPMDHPG